MTSERTVTYSGIEEIQTEEKVSVLGTIPMLQISGHAAG